MLCAKAVDCHHRQPFFLGESVVVGRRIDRFTVKRSLCVQRFQTLLHREVLVCGIGYQLDDRARLIHRHNFTKLQGSVCSEEQEFCADRFRSFQLQPVVRITVLACFRIDVRQTEIFHECRAARSGWRGQVGVFHFHRGVLTYFLVDSADVQIYFLDLLTFRHLINDVFICKIGERIPRSSHRAERRKARCDDDDK